MRGGTEGRSERREGGRGGRGGRERWEGGREGNTLVKKDTPHLPCLVLSKTRGAKFAAAALQN